MFSTQVPEFWSGKAGMSVAIAHLMTNLENVAQGPDELRSVYFANVSLPVLYRLLVDPRARRTHSVAIVHSGSKQTIFGCVCGATHTAAASYRNAKHVDRFRARHEQCMRRTVEAAIL